MPGAMAGGFHHAAVFYADDDEYLAGLLPDLRAAVGGAVLVAVSDEKTALLREALGADADAVRFVDMERLGRNPACIIPAWREFLADTGPGPVLGIGEPAWPGRSDAELVECRRHETLLNLAFDDGRDWRLLCPYDVQRLPPDVLADARRTHPHTSDGPSDDYRGPRPWDDALPPPASRPAELAFTADDVALVRRFVAAYAGVAGRRLPDLMLAVNELATNSIRHGGGGGRLRIWRERRTLMCEVADRGHIADPLAGRERSPDADGSGRGLWLVNHLCDLVQLRTSPAGSIIRLHISC